MVRTKVIPAGKHAGKHRERLNAPHLAPIGGGSMSFRHVRCGQCWTRYKAHKRSCPECGGPHGDDDEDSDTGVTHE